MLITEILARNARMYAAKTALVEREPEKNKRREISWKAFDDQANQVAQALIARGIKKGDRVVHLMTNCLEWLPIYFGILRTGAWAVPLNFRFVAKTILRCAQTAESKAFIFGEEFIDRINTIKSDLDKFVETYIFVGPEAMRPDYAEPYEEVLISQPKVDPAAKISITDEAALYFTSGTTSMPKMVERDHAYGLAHTITGDYWMGLREDDIHWTLTDTGWAKAAWGLFFPPLLAGSAIMLYDGEGFDAEHSFLSVKTNGKSDGVIPSDNLTMGLASLLPARYEKLAEMVDGHAERVDEPGEIRPAVERALASDRVAVVHIRMDPKVTRMSGGVYLR